jgi:hypothetical protein
MLSRVGVIVGGVWTGNRIYSTLKNVTTNNYDSFFEVHTPKIIVTAAHIESYQCAVSSPVVAC